VTPLDPERIEIAHAIRQRAQRRGLVQGAMRWVLQKFSYSRNTVIRCRQFHTTVRSTSLTAAAADTALHDRIHSRAHPPVGSAVRSIVTALGFLNNSTPSRRSARVRARGVTASDSAVTANMGGSFATAVPLASATDRRRYTAATCRGPL
jgi:hypothetical protein